MVVFTSVSHILEVINDLYVLKKKTFTEKSEDPVVQTLCITTTLYAQKLINISPTNTPGYPA